MPPIVVRRVFLDPLVFVIALAGVIFSPIFFAVAFVADLFVPGRWRVVRFTRLAVTAMFYEVLGLIVVLDLWVVSGFGAKVRDPRFRKIHYAVLGWWISAMSRGVQSALGLTIEHPRNPPIDGPVIVFSRHAGPGDSIFLAGTLLHEFGRYPRIVGKKELEFAPFFDIMGHRLPMRFIRPHPKQRELALEAVRDAASGLGPKDAFVLFPEGGNYTPKRKKRAIESLDRHGMTDQAEAARALHNLLPPHPSGALAAIGEAPDADVVFVAHTGTEDLTSMGVIWAGSPFDRTIKANYWHVEPADIPAGVEAQTRWLYEQWELVDAWIDEHRDPATREVPM
ncbi:MAG: 1-acyl-sn-glycerol-3-phosphate acyltransferase [Acidimicrobiia bacterium]